MRKKTVILVISQHDERSCAILSAAPGNIFASCGHGYDGYVYAGPGRSGFDTTIRFDAHARFLLKLNWSNYSN